MHSLGSVVPFLTYLALSGTSRLHSVHTLGVGGFDRESEGDKPAETAIADLGAMQRGELRTAVETRTRGEAYADLRQAVESDWDRHRKFDAPRGELARFEPERAGLPEVSIGEAARYIERHRGDRPWLLVLEGASPEARRVIVAVDQGSGHPHIRHEGWVTEEAGMRRAAYLEDPAQLDPGKRRNGTDGLRAGSGRHVCADIASRITDPDAFATAYARGAAHPGVRAALAAPYDRRARPDPVDIPIAALLGRDGHKVCTGWQLEPVDGSMEDAVANRRAWRAAIADGCQPRVPEPRVRPVPTFEGGTILFTIGHNRQRNGYEIASLFPQPRPPEPDRR